MALSTDYAIRTGAYDPAKPQATASQGTASGTWARIVCNVRLSGICFLGPRSSLAIGDSTAIVQVPVVKKILCACISIPEHVVNSLPQFCCLMQRRN